MLNINLAALRDYIQRTSFIGFNHLLTVQKNTGYYKMFSGKTKTFKKNKGEMNIFFFSEITVMLRCLASSVQHT
jgi:hypothetical protein